MGKPEAEQIAGEAEDDDLGARALHGVKWATLANWTGQLSGLVTMLVLARLLVPAEFGIYAIGSACVTVIMGISQVGLPLALLQRETIEDEHLDTSFWTVTGLAIGFIVIAFVFGGAFAALMKEPELAALLPALSLALPLWAMAGIYNTPLMRRLDFRKAALVTSSGSIAGGVAAVALALAGAGPWSLVGQSLVAALVSLLLLTRVSPFVPRWRFSLARLRELWRFGSTSMVTDLVGLADQRSAPLLLGIFVGAAPVGLYSMARRVIDLGQQAFVASVGQVATPAFSRLQSDRPRMWRAYLNAVQSVAAITFPMFGFTALFAREIVIIFLGPNWIEGAPVLAMVALAALIQSYAWIGLSVLIAVGHVRTRLALQLVGLALTLAVIFGLWPYGIVAVVQGMVVKAAIMHAVYVIALRRALDLRVRDYATTVLPVLFSAVLAIGLAAGLRYALPESIGPFALLVAACVPALALYLVAVTLTAPVLVARLTGYAKQVAAPIWSAWR